MGSIGLLLSGYLVVSWLWCLVIITGHVVRILFPVTYLASAQVTAHIITSSTVLTSGMIFPGVLIGAFSSTAVGTLIEADRIGTEVANSETWKRNWVSVADCQMLASPTLINGCHFICAGGGEEKTAKNRCAPGPAGSALQRPSCFPVATPSTTVSKSGVPFPSTWSTLEHQERG